MRSFDGLHVEVALALVLEHSGVPTVGQWARVAIAEASEVVLISTESLGDSPKFKG